MGLRTNWEALKTETNMMVCHSASCSLREAIYHGVRPGGSGTRMAWESKSSRGGRESEASRFAVSQCGWRFVRTQTELPAFILILLPFCSLSFPRAESDKQDDCHAANGEEEDADDQQKSDSHLPSMTDPPPGARG